MKMQIRNNMIEISIVGERSFENDAAIKDLVEYTRSLKMVKEVIKTDTSVSVKCETEAVDFLASLLRKTYSIGWVEYDNPPEDVVLTIDEAKAMAFFLGLIEGKY